MLRETLKQEIDTLSENQLLKLAELLRIVKAQTQKLADTLPFWQQATPTERAQDFQNWVAQRPTPTPGISLSDEAFDRDSIYD